MVRIITIDREYGSGGGVIAEKVAVRLGWKLWDQLLTDEIARRMDCSCDEVACRSRESTGMATLRLELPTKTMTRLRQQRRLSSVMAPYAIARRNARSTKLCTHI